MNTLRLRLTGRLTRRLANAGDLAFSVYCVVFAFSCYFCMYGFRKPFSVGLFGSADQKALLIAAQLVGYTLSKFLGIKVVSEAGRRYRAPLLLGLILAAELAWLLFAVVPERARFACVFLNGLPLGMVWGLVFSYIEGRRRSALFGAGLSASFIVASGAAKSVGRLALLRGVPEAWMPFASGLLFLPPLLLSVFFLDALPPPSPEEERLRSRRQPMDQSARRDFFRRFAPSLVLLTATYVGLTAYRDYRDNFAREIWTGLGYGSSPGIFAWTEIPVALGVLGSLGLLGFVRDPRRSFAALYGFILVGTAGIGISTGLYAAGHLSPIAWMIASGLGLFIAYVPFGCIFYDSLLALAGLTGTAGFMIYVSDAFGYLGSLIVMIGQRLGLPALTGLDFFIHLSYAVSAAGVVGLLLALRSLSNGITGPREGRVSP